MAVQIENIVAETQGHKKLILTDLTTDSKAILCKNVLPNSICVKIIIHNITDVIEDTCTLQYNDGKFIDTSDKMPIRLLVFINRYSFISDILLKMMMERGG